MHAPVLLNVLKLLRKRDKMLLKLPFCLFSRTCLINSIIHKHLCIILCFNLILAITEGGELYDIHGPQSTESGPDTQSFAAFNQSDHTGVSVILFFVF